MRIPGYLRDRTILTIVLLILFTIFGLVSMTAITGNSLNTENSVNNSLIAGNSVYASTSVTVKVNGNEVIPGSTDKVKNYLNYANKNLVSDVYLNGLMSTVVVSNSLNTKNSADNSSNTESNATPVTIKVLIYDGDGVIPGSVDGVENCLNYANNENITLNVHFNYSTTRKINSGTLSGYDVLIMPGGLATTYLENPEIDAEDLKNFLYSGKGYLGICAGSYAASSHVDGYYGGWGIAPHVNSKAVNYMGKLQISLTSNGENVLNSLDVETIYHWNGPAMYRTDGSNDSMAEYADNKTGYQNYAAIMGDTYGSGRVVLSGPHPELSPTKPEMLVYMIMWAAKKI